MKDTLLSVFVVVVILGLLGWVINSSPKDLTPTGLQGTEICKVIEHKQVVRSPGGAFRIAIIERGNKELKDIYLDEVPGHSIPAISEIPEECRYIYVTGLNEGKVTSIVPVYPK